LGRLFGLVGAFWRAMAASDGEKNNLTCFQTDTRSYSSINSDRRLEDLHLYFIRGQLDLNLPGSGSATRCKDPEGPLKLKWDEIFV
jgi:hypothetical protein